MVVSFTISKKGKRYRPEPKSVEERNKNIEKDQDFHSDGAPSTQAQNQHHIPNHIQGNPTMHTSSATEKSIALFKSTLEQLEALGPSFSLNLFDNGFTIGDTEEIFCDVPKNLIPYNCSYADSIFTDVKCGRLPTGIQDMPLKYVNGTVLCESRDYRVFIEFPIVDTFPLKMSLDNIIEDMSSMPQEFSYGDWLEFEATVLRHLYPHLNLDPTPMLKFRSNETTPMIDLGVEEGNKRRRMGVLTDAFDSLVDRFNHIEELTRRHGLTQRKPVEDPSCSTSRYSTNLVMTRLNEVAAVAEMMDNEARF